MSSEQHKPENAIVGDACKDLKKLVKKYAEKDTPVLFFGETGSGKELFARLYMDASKRSGGQRTINCAAFPAELLRSEVFGHVTGAFTGATKDRKGLIATCEGGILFLDELGEATNEFQSTILRVTENNCYSPLGSDEEKQQGMT
jgi:transcriptional regulator with PAS, ATPase and Fis domain